MVGIYQGTAGARGGATRIVMSYQGLSLNNPSDTLSGASGPDTYEINTAVGGTSLDYISEVNPQRDGLEIYPMRKVSRVLTMKGTIRAPSLAVLHDKIKALALAFDPARIAHDQLLDADNMFTAFDFSVPTADTANYASGLVPSRYYALSLRIPDPVIDYSTGFAAFFDVVLLIKDPRRYWQTQSTLSGAGTINNALADYFSWPTLTITMAGAGSATYSITNTTSLHGAKTLVLNLSGLANGNVVTVNMERRSIKVGTTETASLYVSGDYFHIDPVASNAIAYTNPTNATSVVTYRRAWCI